MPYDCSANHPQHIITTAKKLRGFAATNPREVNKKEGVPQWGARFLTLQS